MYFRGEGEFPSPLSVSPTLQYLTFLCIFFIEVVTLVSLFSPDSIFLDPCVLLLLCLSSTNDLCWNPLGF